MGGPLSPLSFHLSRTLLGAWRFGLFRCVSLSQQARPHQGACLWGVLFSQFIPVCFIRCKDEKVLLVLVPSID